MGLYYCHRLAWLYMTGRWPSEQIDHENLDRSDTRFKNLREATWSQNQQHKLPQKNNKTGVTGVDFLNGIQRYRARYKQGGREFHVGVFATLEEAKAARAAAIAYRGKFIPEAA
jgi:hypothetical protein